MEDRAPAARSGERLVGDEDLQWLLDIYATGDGALSINAGRAAQELYQPDAVDHSNIVLGLADEEPASGLFSYWRSVIELNSETAVAAREQWREHARRQRELAQRRDSERDDEWVNPRIAEGIAEGSCWRCL